MARKISSPPRTGKAVVVAALVVLVGLVAATAVWQRQDSYRTRRDLVLQGNLTAARIAAEVVEAELQARLRLVEGFALRPDFAQVVASKDWATATIYVEAIRGLDDKIGSAAVLDAEGKLWARTPADPSILARDFSSRDYFQGAVRSKGPYLSEVFVQKGTPQATVVAFASSVRDNGGKIIGVIVATLPISKLNALTKEVEVPNKGSILIFDQADHALTGGAAGAQGTFETSVPVARAMAGDSGVGELDVPGLSGKRLVAYAPVPEVGWSVLVEQPRAHALSPVRSLTWRLGGIAALVILIALMAALVTGRLLREVAGERTQKGAILDSTLDSIISMDHEGKITDFNPAAERTFGYERAEVIGKPVADVIIPPTLRDAHRRGLAHYLATGEGPVLGKVVELTAMRADGSEFPVELSITRIDLPGLPSFTGIVRDITERKQAEEALRDSEARKSAILASIADGVVTVDPEGKIISINPAMEELAGWQQEEVLGRLYFEVYPLFDQRGEILTLDQRFLSQAMGSRQVVVSRGYNLLLLARDGRRVPVGNAAAPILTKDGDLLGGVAVIRDISHDREVDQMKSALVSTVSHELRTPLTMIQGFSELLLERDVGEVKSRQALQQINASAERLSRLIEDLLSVSRIESGRLVVRATPVELPGVVEEVLAPFAEREDREFRTDLNGGLPPVLADRDMLVQILTNLVSNAIKYSPAGAPVDLATTINGNSVELSVEDHGIGMSEEEAAQLFEKFYRVDRPEVREVGGTGLGLYITKNLVELQGGQMWVRSRLEGGTTFAFSLPIATTEEVEVQE